MNSPELKSLTARSIKWNIIDRVSSQFLYAVTGIILARLLSQEDFGLVGAILVFQAFASLMVDSGFSYALIQRRRPSRLDYSTVLWFNIAVAIGVYIVLFFCAPLIADCFKGDQRIVPLSRVMFLSFILNASAIVQTNRLMKRMDVRMIAVSNCFGLLFGAVVGIWLAFAGYGAWAIVWQTLSLNAVKSIVLWTTSRWRPLWQFSPSSLRSYFKVGSGMMASSALNVLFQNIYAFFIGNRVGLISLGYYSQADKWSKMGITSISQVLTSSFLPTLSEVQNDAERFNRASQKMNRFTAYILMPAMGFLAIMAPALFHCLFGYKWDASIVLFQLLLLRGVFTVLSSLYNNYLIAKAQTRAVVIMESLRDGVALLFLLSTLPFITLTTPTDSVFGVRLLLYGQVAASAITWAVMTFKVAKTTSRPAALFVLDNAPYIAETIIIGMLMYAEGVVLSSYAPTSLLASSWAILFIQAVTGIGLYLLVNHFLHSNIQREIFAHLRRRQIHNT